MGRGVLALRRLGVDMEKKPQVTFNHTDEFLEELQKDRAMIDRGIVRVTNQFVHSATSPIRFAHAVATYSVDGQVVKLDRYCGELWGIEREDAKTKAELEATQELVRKACDGLEVRAGILES